VTGRKSEANGVLEKEAPVSKTIGRVGVRAKFGWRVGTESETGVAEATAADAVVTELTAEPKWAEADNGVVVGSTPIPMNSCVYR